MGGGCGEGGIRIGSQPVRIDTITIIQELELIYEHKSCRTKVSGFASEIVNIVLGL